MPFARFSLLLRQTIGLDPESIGASAVERAVRERLAASGADGLDAYWERVQASESELQLLIETVIVPETWFFRVGPAFEALARLAREQFARAPERPLRLLSLPCSTGEEPYSMAMALLDAGVPPAQFQIDAIDICTRSLAIAERAIYGRNSFRGSALDYRARHFTQTPHGHQLSDAVRRQVRFRYGNLFGPALAGGAMPYDFVFCRNLLIYFDRPTQERAIAVLDKLLCEKGVLFSGPAEAGPLVSQELVSAGISQAFAFRKPAAAEAPVTPKARPLPRMAPQPVRRSTATQQQQQPARTVRPIATVLSQAIQLANQGQLAEAATLCRQSIEQSGASAAAFCLMGVLSDAGGDRGGAAEWYRKALYLEPGHHETLVHLAALLDLQGDAAGARRLGERARRAQAKAPA
ncbi:MAG: CheR family methyltransferase [Pseudomonadota bacterium]